MIHYDVTPFISSQKFWSKVILRNMRLEGNAPKPHYLTLEPEKLHSICEVCSCLEMFWSIYDNYFLPQAVVCNNEVVSVKGLTELCLGKGYLLLTPGHWKKWHYAEITPLLGWQLPILQPIMKQNSNGRPPRPWPLRPLWMATMPLSKINMALMSFLDFLICAVIIECSLEKSGLAQKQIMQFKAC